MSLRIRQATPPAPPTDAPEEFEFIAFFRSLAVRSDGDGGAWTYEVRDERGVQLRFDLDTRTRRVEVDLSTGSKPFAKVELENVDAVVINADAGELTVRTDGAPANSALVVRVFPHIGCDWTSKHGGR